MSASAILTEIISILVGGLTTFATGIGSALSSLVTAIFFTGTGETQTLSIFGIMIIVFAGIALAVGLCRWVLNFLTSLGARNR